MLSPNVLRPFPAEEFRRRCSGVKAVDHRRPRRLLRRRRRQPLARGARGAPGRSATTTRWCSRASTAWAARTSTRADAEAFFDAGARGGRSRAGRRARSPTTAPRRASPDARRAPGPAADPRRRDVSRGMAQGDAGRGDRPAARSSSQPLWKMTAVPSRIAPGTRRLPGLRRLPDAAPGRPRARGRRRRAVPDRLRDGGDDRLSRRPRTASTTSTTCSRTARATLSGLVEMYHERVRRGELPEVEGHHVRDGHRRRRHGHRHGRRRIGAAHRNHRMIILEYDNQGYMNTGAPALVLDAVRPPHLDQRGRRRAARQALPPQGHARRSSPPATCRTCSRRARAIPRT